MTNPTALFSRLLAGLLPFVAACAIAQGGPADSTASTSEAVVGGTTSSYPIVQVGGQPGGITGPCSGILLSDSWVLTGFNCAELASEPVTVCVTPQPGPCATSSEIVVRTGPSYANLIHLAQPLEHLASYPTVSTTPISLGEQLVCAGTSPAGPTQGVFAMSTVQGPGYYQAAPVGTATLQGSDMGGGCFEGATLSALIGKAGFEVFDLSGLGPAFTSTMCGGAQCGTVIDGANTISCGTCDEGERCRAGSCVPVVVHPPPCGHLCQ